jgi:hypothetical protein
MGLGGGVVAMVYPIQAPMARIATDAMVTGVCDEPESDVCC